MKKYVSQFFAAARTSLDAMRQFIWSRFLTRRELRTTLVAAVLAGFAPFASAVSLDDLGSATDASHASDGKRSAFVERGD